jgi:hypothetical protein
MSEELVVEPSGEEVAPVVEVVPEVKEEAKNSELIEEVISEAVELCKDALALALRGLLARHLK